MGIEAAATAVLTVLILVLAWNDLRHYLLPNALTASLAVLGLVFNGLLDMPAIGNHFIGILAGFGSFEVIRRSYRRLRGRDGLGAGDAKLMAGAGAWVGWMGLPSVVLIGTLIALSATLAVTKLRGDSLSTSARVPLGAYLAAGLWLTWVFGPIAV
jgi:leader peptidase (prepilin peptidase)/N-methyltransferase